MSFQHFRLGELALQHPLPPHLTQHQAPPAPSTSTFSALNPTNPVNPPKSISGKPKQPYGSGDSDDGYTLIFPNLAAFQEWRAQEEERQSVEFVKGDTHGSKAVPPRFKDHTKLVCARHSRSGRKKYVKKHPERIRKVPSRKLEGQGCPASISFKTYFDTDEVRACYQSQHSHEIGQANLPYTRRGRRATAATREKDPKSPTGAPLEPAQPELATTNASVNAPPPAPHQPPNIFTSSVSMIAPLPAQPQPQYQPPQPFTYAPATQQFPPTLPPAVHSVMSHDRWENMATMFHSIREYARGFEYPSVSIAALETVLIRLYLESPVGLGAQPGMATLQNQVAPSHVTGARAPNATGGGSGSASEVANGNSEESS